MGALQCVSSHSTPRGLLGTFYVYSPHLLLYSHSEEIWKSVLFRLLWTLEDLQDRFKLVHQDFHADNIILATGLRDEIVSYKRGGTAAVYEVRTYGIYPVILDFEFASVFCSDMCFQYKVGKNRFAHEPDCLGKVSFKHLNQLMQAGDDLMAYQQCPELVDGISESSASSSSQVSDVTLTTEDSCCVQSLHIEEEAYCPPTFDRSTDLARLFQSIPASEYPRQVLDIINDLYPQELKLTSEQRAERFWCRQGYLRHNTYDELDLPGPTQFLNHTLFKSIRV